MNKVSGGDGIPVELFQILKDDAVKVLHSICQQIWKTQQWPQDQKRSVFIPVPKKGNAKECSNYCTVVFISHASKVMLKILQVRLQQSMNCSMPGLPVHHQLPEFTKLMSIESLMPSNHLILCRPLLPPSIFPSIRDFLMSHFFASVGRSIGVSASASVLPMNIQD